MGIRLSIYIEGDPDNYYGDDHKMYGYWAYEEVKKSFDYLAEIIKSECPDWEDWVIGKERMLGLIDEDIPQVLSATNKDLYGATFCYGMGCDLVVNNEQFCKFTDLYLADLVSTGHTESCVKAATDYMTLLAGKEENKVLDWS